MHDLQSNHCAFVGHRFVKREGASTPECTRCGAIDCRVKSAPVVPAAPVVEIPRPLRVVDDRPMPLSEIVVLTIVICLVFTAGIFGLAYLLAGHHPLVG